MENMREKRFMSYAAVYAGTTSQLKSSRMSMCTRYASPTIEHAHALESQMHPSVSRLSLGTHKRCRNKQRKHILTPRPNMREGRRRK